MADFGIFLSDQIFANLHPHQAILAMNPVVPDDEPLQCAARALYRYNGRVSRPNFSSMSGVGDQRKMRYRLGTYCRGTFADAQ